MRQMFFTQTAHTSCLTCFRSMAVLHRIAGGVTGVPQVAVDHITSGRCNHPPRLHQGGTQWWFKCSCIAMLFCVLFCPSWPILTLWMVATKRRMAAARWKRMMKAKMINMAALLRDWLVDRRSGPLNCLAGCVCLSLSLWRRALVGWRSCLCALLLAVTHRLVCRGQRWIRCFAKEDSVGNDM